MSRRVYAAEMAGLVPHPITMQLVGEPLNPLTEDDLKARDNVAPKLMVDYEGDIMPASDRLMLYHQHLIHLAFVQDRLITQKLVRDLAAKIEPLLGCDEEQLAVLGQVLIGQ